MDIEIISTKACAYCRLAKKELADANIPYRETLLDTPEQKSAFRRAGFTTVPQVYVNNAHIGGYEDLHAWLRKRALPEQQAL